MTQAELKVEGIAQVICATVYGPWDKCADWQHDAARSAAKEAMDNMPDATGWRGMRDAFTLRLAASLGGATGTLTIIVIGVYLLRWLFHTSP